jgi:FkbM family methyltransferase
MLITDRLRTKKDSVSIDSLLLKETKGVTIKDKLVLFSLKNIYLASCLLRMIVLGNKKRHRLHFDRGISFSSFLSKSIKLLGIDNLLLLVNVHKYGYQVYFRCKNSFNDFVIITQHERFFPKEGDMVVDIGAEIGIYTITSSKCVGPNGKVIAIGPDPAIGIDPADFEILNRNIRSNNLTNVMPFDYIAYSKEMEKVFVEYPNKIVAVRINTLDNLLQQNGINEVNWIKIGVQGAELEVLKGAHNVLSKSKDISILLEIHGHNNYRPVIEYLYSYNFVVTFEKSYECGDKYIIARKSSLPR